MTPKKMVREYDFLKTRFQLNDAQVRQYEKWARILVNRHKEFFKVCFEKGCAASPMTFCFKPGAVVDTVKVDCFVDGRLYELDLSLDVNGDWVVPFPFVGED